MHLRGARLGSMVGAVGGLAFVEINAGGLPGSLVVRIVGVLVFVAAVVVVLRAPEREPGVPAGSPRSSRLGAIAMVVAFVVGVAATLVGTADALGWTGVVAGFVLLALSLSVAAEGGGGVGSPYAGRAVR